MASFKIADPNDARLSVMHDCVERARAILQTATVLAEKNLHGNLGDGVLAVLLSTAHDLLIDAEVARKAMWNEAKRGKEVSHG